jgi:hypothetical protein
MMDVSRVGHESRRQRDDIELDEATDQVQVKMDVLFRIGFPWAASGIRNRGR